MRTTIFTPVTLLLVVWGTLQSTLCAGEPVVRELPGPPGQPAVVCTVYPPDAGLSGPVGLVVHLYGSGGSHREFNAGRPSYDEFRRTLAARGTWLVVPELGPRHWMNEAACARVDAVIAAMIEQEKVDPTRVQLLGTSMGGGSSLMYVMQRPGKIRAVAAVFPMTDFERWLREQPGYRNPVEQAHRITDANRQADLKKISPLAHPAAFLKTPVFLLHGAQDKIVPPEHSRDFAAALQKAGCTVIYREAATETHRDEIAQPYQQELADFFTKAAD